MAAIGIKETKEVLIALNALGKFVIDQKKQHSLGIQDAVALVEKVLLDSAFKQIMVDAVDKIGQVPEELKNLDFQEALDLGMYEASEIKGLFDALKA